MIIYIPLLFAIIGALIYAFSQNGKVAEIGRMMFACGLFVFLFFLGDGRALVLR